jgi:hypothetical protein
MKSDNCPIKHTVNSDSISNPKKKCRKKKEPPKKVPVLGKLK